MTNPRALAALLAGIMALQAVLGLAFRDQYRDAEWVRVAWLGNDWVTLLLAVPLLVAALALSRRGSVRGQLLGLGVIAYGLYNYAFYLLGAALNVFFPIYAAAFVLSVATLILALAGLRSGEVAARFSPATPVRVVGGYLVFVAFGLAVVWLGMWAAHVFGGRPTPVEPDAFRLVAALDLALMVPALATGGILLWRRQSWGYVIATVAGIQGALYLILLSVNSALMIARGLAQAPGELPVWGTLAAVTTAAVVVLLASVGDRLPGEGRPPGP